MVAAYVTIFFLGLLAGSFANVLIYRIPLKKSVIAPAAPPVQTAARS
ncbi:MAG: prepilin peptidase [Acetivibrionales bacterium]